MQLCQSCKYSYLKLGVRYKLASLLLKIPEKTTEIPKI